MTAVQYAILDMSETHPYVCIIVDGVVQAKYPIDRACCTREYLETHEIFPQETQYIICISPEQERCKIIFERWENALIVPRSPRECIPMCAEYSYCNTIPVSTIDKGSAILLGLALHEEYHRVSMRTGIVLLYAGEYRTAVISMYRGILYGSFGFCSALIEEEEIGYVLEQFKNRWLPEEEIQDMGGCGSIFANNIPEEAVFSTTYYIGKKIKKYENKGRCIPYEYVINCVQRSAETLIAYMISTQNNVMPVGLMSYKQ